MERFQQTHLTDVAIVVEGQKLWVSRVLLAHFSPVFERMFYGDFRESQEQEVALPSKPLNDVVELLSCLIPGPDLKEVDWENVCLLFSLAEEYQIAWLKQRCLEFLRWQTAELEEGEEQLLDALILAAWLGSEEMQNKLLPKVARLADEKVSYEQLQLLPPPVLAAYYQAKVNKARSRLTHILNPQEALGHCVLHSHYAGKVRRCGECQQSFCDQHGRTTMCKCSICSKSFFPSDTARFECHCAYDYDRSLITDDGPMNKAKFLANCRDMIGPAWRRQLEEQQLAKEEAAAAAAAAAKTASLLKIKKR